MTRNEHAARPNRESLSKRLGKIAKQIAERDGHKCAYCGATKESSGTYLQLDHLTPKSLGGEDVASNLVLSCRSCNSRRGNKTLTEWAIVSPELTFTARSIRAQARRKLAA